MCIVLVLLPPPALIVRRYNPPRRSVAFNEYPCSPALNFPRFSVNTVCPTIFDKETDTLFTSCILKVTLEVPDTGFGKTLMLFTKSFDSLIPVAVVLIGTLQTLMTFTFDSENKSNEL